MFGVWLVAALLVSVGVGLGVTWWRSRRRGPSPQEIRKLFSQQREHLEARFFEAAASSGKPRGLRWKECEWADLVEFGRDVSSGQFVAFVGVTIAFEAVAGGDMEGVEAVG